MSALRSLLVHVPPSVVNRGMRYFDDGRVRDFRFDGEIAHARVMGSELYDTRIRFEPGGGVVTSCSCEAFDTYGEFCKHVVAVLVAIERGSQPGEVSWRALAAQTEPITRAERDVRYRVVIDKNAHEPVSIQALTPRAKGGERIVPLHEVARIRPSDRTLVDLVASPGYFWGGRQSTPIEARRAPLVLPLLAQTGRASVTVDGDEETPLEYDAGPSFDFGVACDMDGDALLVRGELVRGNEHVDLGTPRFLLASGLVLLGSRLARAAIPSFAWVQTLRKKTMRVAEREVEDFAEFASTAAFSITLPPALRYERVTAKPKLVVRIFSAGPRVSANVSFDYDGKRVAERGALVDRAKKRVWIRDEIAERDWLDAMRAAGFKLNEFEITIGRVKLPRAVRDLTKLGARVEGERGALFRAATRFSSRVSSGIDWLDLEAAAHFDGEEIALPTLLAAVKRGDQFVTLGDGSLGMLPEEWLARFALYGDLGEAKGDAIRFQRSQVAIVDALLDSVPEVTADAAVQKLRNTMHEKPASKSAPKAFSGELRAYQEEGLGWLHWLERARLGGCLADDMGLGKTVQVLAHLAGRRTKKPSLVVAPRSVVFNWKNETARFAPRLRVLEHVGTDRDVSAIAKADLVITTYGTLRRDIEALSKIEFDYAILDEAQAIKNRLSVSAKASRLLRADNRLVLTGTPVENHVQELGSLFSFVEPGLLNGPALERLDDRGAVRDALARILRPFVLRRTKAQVAPELPDRIEQTRFVDLDKDERARYTQLRDHYRKRILETKGGDKPMHVLEAILRLRQAACHPGLIDDAARGETSAKVDALLADLEEVTASGHKALVFSQFTSLLSIVRDRLDTAKVEYEYLDGQTRDRQTRIERFQSDEGPKVFLISLKAGGVGLNLTAAEYVFLLDPWWNPAVEAQAIDRAHRIGQTRTVMAYRIIARDTIEERVLTLQDRKRALFESLFGDGGSVGALTTDDLDMLLS